MDIDINVKIGGKDTGMMGVSLEEIQSKSIIKKKKKKKRKSDLMQAIESAIPARTKYTTEVI